MLNRVALQIKCRIYLYLVVGDCGITIKSIVTVSMGQVHSFELIAWKMRLLGLFLLQIVQLLTISVAAVLTALVMIPFNWL